jgi:hypothetical protein
MLCSSCNSENSGDATFCEQCGARLEARCPSCQTPVSQGARFCKKCGISLGGSEPVSAGSAASQIRVASETSESQTSDGERKTVTALFAESLRCQYAEFANAFKKGGKADASE